jgi:outer membrane lipoprotein-sorting protein
VSPQEELLLTNGKVVWWYIPEEKEVHIFRDMDLSGELAPLLTFLSSLEELKKHFKVKNAITDKSRPNQNGLILEPKKKDSIQGIITVWCLPDFMLTGFKMESVTGERTDFYLTNLEDNPSLSEDFFDFSVPKGVKVIEESTEE